MHTSLSRRGFAKVLGASAAYAALNPSFASSASPLRLVKNASPLVRLNSNENPWTIAAGGEGHDRCFQFGVALSR